MQLGSNRSSLPSHSTPDEKSTACNKDKLYFGVIFLNTSVFSLPSPFMFLDREGKGAGP